MESSHFNYLYLHKLSLETNNLHFRKAFRSLDSCLVKRVGVGVGTFIVNVTLNTHYNTHLKYREAKNKQKGNFPHWPMFA